MDTVHLRSLYTLYAQQLYLNTDTIPVEFNLDIIVIAFVSESVEKDQYVIQIIMK